MKLTQKILLVWLAFGIVNFAAAMSLVVAPSVRICNFLLGSLSAMLGVVSVFLLKREPSGETKALFFILAGLFFVHGLGFGIFYLIKSWLFPTDEWATFFVDQYRQQLYFLLLSGCINYLIIDLTMRRYSKAARYFLSAAMTICVCGSQFYPYVFNAKYLYTTQDIVDFRLIRSTIEELNKNGNPNPSIDDIASRLGVRPPDSDRLGFAHSDAERMERVSEIVPYLSGDEVTLLVWRPLWHSCVVVALIAIASILCFVFYNYVIDPPKRAYLEKILWCLLPLCGFEALHYSVFMRVKNMDEFRSTGVIGMYASMAVLAVLLLLLLLRLRFVESIEGRFYERRLVQDASSITRWRDAFDNWVLRQFMDPRELNQRFLVHPNEHDYSGGPNTPSEKSK